MRFLRQIATVVDFFIPQDVLISILLVFAMENVVDTLISQFVPDGWTLVTYGAIYILTIALLGASRFLSADTEDLAELEDSVNELADYDRP